MRPSMHACTSFAAQLSADQHEAHPRAIRVMSGHWSAMEHEWAPYASAPAECPYPGGRCCDPYHCFPPPRAPVSRYPPIPQPAPSRVPLPAPSRMPPPAPSRMPHPMPVRYQAPLAPATDQPSVSVAPRGDNPREIRNKAEKQRRDKLNTSIAELAAMVPPVLAASRRFDKTGILRLTAHYLRAHQYVFGDSLAQGQLEITAYTALALLRLLKGFLLTVTYRGLVVVISQNVQQYLGYSELDLLGQNVMTIVHEDDRRMLREQLMPRSDLLGPNGELLLPEDPEERQKVADELANEKRRFVIRFKKLTQRSEPPQYLTCYVEGSLRKADRACRGYSRCCQVVRRARARSDNPCSSGNDVVFIGLVRPSTETFVSERHLEAFRMEYRTRHSVDGEIIQCDQKISLVTGYMTHEVYGLNAMNFMHRDDVRWVIVALREMYVQHHLMGESCYRLLSKNGQMIYMRTRGCLEVDHSSRAVTTFVCTNTVVDEEEGKYLIGLMKKKFNLVIDKEESPPVEEVDDQNVSVEDPRQLEKVILHMMKNLPSPELAADSPQSSNSDGSFSPSQRLAIIPPKKERTVSSIGKIYGIIKDFNIVSNPTVNNVLDTTEVTDPVMDIRPMTILQNSTLNNVMKQMENIPEPNNSLLMTCENQKPLDTFEDTFLKAGEESYYNCDSGRSPLVQDQVLAAVQLTDCNAPGLGGQGATKRPVDYDEHNIGLSYKRQNCEQMKINYYQQEEYDQAIGGDDFDSNCIQNLLLESDNEIDTALSFLQAMGETGESTDVFPDILLESDLQELLGPMVSEELDENLIDEAASYLSG